MFFTAKQKEKFATIKGLLGKATVPMPQTFVPIPLTPEKRQPVNQNIQMMSPGGSKIDIPILECHDIPISSDAECEQNTSNTISLFNQDLKTVSEFTITPVSSADVNQQVPAVCGDTSNSLSQAAVNSVTLPAFQSIVLGSNITVNSNQTSSETSTKKRKGGRKKKVAAQSSGESSSGEKKSCDLQSDGMLAELGPGEKYTATPIVGNTFMNKAHVRSLNFGPNADDPTIAHYRKICPKPNTQPSTPQFIILHTNTVLPANPNTAENTTIESVNSNVGKSGDMSDNDSLSSPRLTRRSARLKNSESKKVDTPKDSISSVEKEEVESINKVLLDTDNSEKVINKSGLMLPLSEESVEDDKNKPFKSNIDNVSESKTKQIKNKKTGEKLKVKIPVDAKVKKEKSSNNKQRTLSVAFTKQDKEVLTDDSNSTDDMPLAELKSKLNNKNSIEIEELNNSFDSDHSNGDGEIALLPHTPKKPVTEVVPDDFTPSKEEMLEKVGLTPKKTLEEISVKTPSRLGAFSEFGTLPSSACCVSPLLKSPLTRGKLKSLDKSPSVAKKKETPAKRLFSPRKDNDKVRKKKKSNNVAKHVKTMIDRLDKTNPEISLTNTREQKDNVNNTEQEIDSNLENMSPASPKKTLVLQIVKLEDEKEKLENVKEQSTKASENVKKSCDSRTRKESGNKRLDDIVKKLSDQIESKQEMKAKKVRDKENIKKGSDKKEKLKEKVNVSLNGSSDSDETNKNNPEQSCVVNTVTCDNNDTKDTNSNLEVKTEQDQQEVEASVNILVDLMNSESTENTLVKEENADIETVDSAVFKTSYTGDMGSEVAIDKDKVQTKEHEPNSVSDSGDRKQCYSVADNNDKDNNQEIISSQTETDVTANASETDFTNVKKKHKKKHKHRHEEGDPSHHRHKHKSKHKKQRHKENEESCESPSKHIKESNGVEASERKHRKKHKHRHRDGHHKSSSKSEKRQREEKEGESEAREVSTHAHFDKCRFS